MSDTVTSERACADPPWRLERRDVEVRGVRTRLRLVRFARGWLASVDTADGPTLGANASPYLAVAGALAPLGVEIAEAMALLSEAD